MTYKDQLQGQLEQLHSELQKIESVDDNERKMLQKQAHDIQGFLESGAIKLMSAAD